MSDERSKKGRHEDDTPRTKSKVDLSQLIDDCELFHGTDGTAYVSFPVDSHCRTAPVKSGAFRAWLARQYYAATHEPAPRQFLQDTVDLLIARALYESPEETVFTRIGEFEDGLNIDLCRDDWRAVRVTAEGWKVIAHPDVRFRRSKGMLTLPTPERGGDVAILRRFLNLAGERDWKLALGWLLSTFMPRGPYPILLLQGEHGSAKSTNARVLRSLIDPNIAPLRARPRTEQDLMIAGTNSWLLAYDNLSGLRSELADSLCRVSTGGGFSARLLYSDDEERIFDIARPVLLTGIDALATREDLADRCVLLTMPPIEEKDRQSETAFWKDFEEVRAIVFGGLLDTLVAILRTRTTIKLSESPRMADFAVWVSAAESVLKWREGSFLKAYARNRAGLIKDAAENDPVVGTIRELLDAEEGTWEGTPTDLMDALTEIRGDRARHDPTWPRAAQWLTNRIRRRVDALRSEGVEYALRRSSGTRVISLTSTK